MAYTKNAINILFLFFKNVLCGCLVSFNLLKKQFDGLKKEKLIDSANSFSLIHLFPFSIVLQVSISLVNKLRFSTFLDAYALK